MVDLCICSDVCNRFMLLTNDDSLFSLETMKSYQIKKTEFEKQIAFVDQEKVAVDLRLKIIHALEGRQIPIKETSTYTLISFENQVLKLNLRISNDFILATLINFWKILNINLHKNGTIYFLNRSLFKPNISGNILSILRNSSGMKRDEIFISVSSLSEKFNSVKFVEESAIILSLNKLMNYGLIDSDEQDIFRVTAKGFMFIL